MRRVFAALVGAFGLFMLIGAIAATITAPSESRAAGLPLLCFAALIGYIAWRMWRNTGGDRSSLDRLAAEAQRFFDHVNDARAFPSPELARLIDSRATPVLAACNAQLFEFQSTGTSHVGTRVKLGSMPVYIGASTKNSPTLKNTALGELGLTTKGLTFISDTRTVDIKFRSIAGVTVFGDGIQIASSELAKPLLFKLSNGILWGQLVRNALQLELNSRQLPDGAKLRLDS